MWMTWMFWALMLMMEKVLQIFNRLFQKIEVALSLDDVLAAAASDEWPAHGAGAWLSLYWCWGMMGDFDIVVALWNWVVGVDANSENQEDDDRLGLHLSSRGRCCRLFGCTSTGSRRVCRKCKTLLLSTHYW